VDEQREDHQVRRPGVDRAHEPAELHLGHEELDRFVRLAGARAVVEEEQDAGGDLDRKEKKRHAAEVVPDGVAVHRHLLFVRELVYLFQPDALVEPGPEFAAACLFGFHQAFLATTIWSPLTLTTYSSSGFGGGPMRFLPFKS
jgi:hypothetical protein